MTARRKMLEGGEYISLSVEDEEDEGIDFEGVNSGQSPDRGPILLLVLLYVLQGVPTGLAFGSVPFLLKSRLSYAQVGLFSLASYPYSLKLLWSPVVDAVYAHRFGRRKSWIIPVQLLSALLLLHLGKSINTLLLAPQVHVSALTLSFLLLVFLASTQDIAVDGWALTLLKRKHLSYASTAQTLGLNTGYFISFTVFLALNSPEFANKYLRARPSPLPLVSLGAYLTFWGWVYLIVTLALALFKKEHTRSYSNPTTITSVYLTIARILKLKHVQLFCAVHLLSKIGFVANDTVTNLKLLEKGFSKEDLALTVLIDFPFELFFGYYVAKWSSGPDPLRPWLIAFVGRLVASLVALVVVYCFPADGHVTTLYFFAVILQNLFGSFMGTVQFVSICAFHTQIADPHIGGSYMTLLNTISNLGGTWPRILILHSVDWFTKATCSLPLANQSCHTQELKSACIAAGGSCTVHQDGYYIVTILTVAAGTALFYLFIKPSIINLQSLPLTYWRLAK